MIVIGSVLIVGLTLSVLRYVTTHSNLLSDLIIRLGLAVGCWTFGAGICEAICIDGWRFGGIIGIIASLFLYKYVSRNVDDN